METFQLRDYYGYSIGYEVEAETLEAALEKAEDFEHSDRDIETAIAEAEYIETLDVE